MPSDDASDAEWEAYWNAYAAATQGPGRVAPEYDEENNTYLASVNFPVAHVGLIDSAASVFHGMMLNNFTCGAFKVTGDVNAFVAAMYNVEADAFVTRGMTWGTQAIATKLHNSDFFI